MMAQALSTDVNRIWPMSDESIARVNAVQQAMMELPQIPIQTQHMIHGGMYARTIMVPAGSMLTGVLIKRPTTLILQGDTTVFANGDTILMDGYNVLACSANRKQAFMCHSDVWMTMLFPTTATTVEEAELEFTDEVELLASRHDPDTNTVIITGE
jgi:hypothetical protein